MLFEDYFEKYTNWLDDPEIDVEAILQSSFSSFYSNGKPDYERIKQGIIDNDSGAKDLFKNLFRLSVHVKTGMSTALASCEVMTAIQTKYGNNIYAHGVEECKGGIHNLLMMCISNHVRVNAHCWGMFLEGMSNTSPLAHGPYYVIYSSNLAKNPDPPTSNKTFEAMEYILVPFSENKVIIEKLLSELVQLKMLNQGEGDSFSQKLIDYQEFLTRLNNNHHLVQNDIRKHSTDKLLNISPVKKKSRTIAKSTQSSRQRLFEADKENIPSANDANIKCNSTPNLFETSPTKTSPKATSSRQRLFEADKGNSPSNNSPVKNSELIPVKQRKTVRTLRF